MTLQTWKEEFYPIEASEVDEKDAIQHSLTKWIGLRKENLDKHDLEFHYGCIEDNEYYLRIDSNSCALCLHYYEREPILKLFVNCQDCPLYKARGNWACDNAVNGTQSPYHEFTDNQNPEPMIALLQKALDSSTKET